MGSERSSSSQHLGADTRLCVSAGLLLTGRVASSSPELKSLYQPSQENRPFMNGIEI